MHTEALKCKEYTCMLKLHTHMCVLSYQSRPTLWAPWTVAHCAPLPMEFSRQEYWSGFPFPTPGDLPHIGVKARFPVLQAILYH